MTLRVFISNLSYAQSIVVIISNPESIRLVTFLGLRTSLFHKGIYLMEDPSGLDSGRLLKEVSGSLISGLWSYFLIVAFL